MRSEGHGGGSVRGSIMELWWVTNALKVPSYRHHKYMIDAARV
ncbi:hypothetical protein [Micromonospora sp. B9E7]